jgi:hypothetical protein
MTDTRAETTPAAEAVLWRDEKICGAAPNRNFKVSLLSGDAPWHQASIEVLDQRQQSDCEQ